MRKLTKMSFAFCASFALLTAFGAVASAQGPGREQGAWQGNRGNPPRSERTFAAPTQERGCAAPTPNAPSNRPQYRPQYQPPSRPQYQPAPPPVFRGQAPPPVVYYPAPPPPPRPNIIAEIIHLFHKHD